MNILVVYERLAHSSSKFSQIVKLDFKKQCIFTGQYVTPCSIFSIDLNVEEGGGSLELTTSGREIEVTANNVYDYVRKYAEYRMYKAQQKALEVSSN